MTKKKPSPQNRIWEKERRERLNKTFEDLHRLLPDHEPSSASTKVEILQQTIEFIGKLQKKIKDLMQECNDPLKDQFNEQEKRLKRLLGRNEELVELLRKAKIAVPPCKYTIPEEERQQRGEEKENGNRGKKAEAKRRRPSAVVKKQPVINQKHPVSHSGSTVGSDALALSGVNSVTMTTNAPAMVVSNSGPGCVQSAPGSLALKHINGLSIGPGNGVNVTPALLSTPIMTTSVLISNNGNLMQMPLVAPPSSLLIVGSEDVRAKLNLKKRPHGGGKGNPKRGKFVIKSIDVIPGRIVDGKIPIAPLRRSTNESAVKGGKMSKLKRKKSVPKGKQSRKMTADATPGVKQSDENGTTESEQARQVNDPSSASAGELQPEDNQQPQSARKETEVAIGTDHSATSLLPAVEKTIRKEYGKENQPNPIDVPQGGHLEHINLNHPDLSEDIFANLQVAGVSNAHGSHDDGSLSPTAAYLMTFPLVAGGGKAAGNHIEAGDGDECDEAVTVAELQTAKKDSASETVLATTGGATEASANMMLDNFSSFFNYGQMETIGAGSAHAVGQESAILHSLPVSSTSNVATVATVAAPPSTRESGFSNYTAIYQSIDNMLEHRPVVPNRTTMGAPAKIPVTSSESEYAASVAFTFTLTSGTSTAPTTSQTGTTSGTNHFYGSSCGALVANPVVKPVVDDFCSPLKPSIEFTFSLTGTTGSQARTVQSQYTNSAILATTMTTPSYDTYGYYHKTVPQTANYCPSFGVLDPLLTTEKPATSFTFCLTSSTKTEPSYTQSSLATAATHTSQAYDTTPKLSTKHPQRGASECFPLKNAAPKLEKASQRAQGSTGGHISSLGTEAHTNGMHQQTTTTSSIVAAPSSSSAASQQNSQSRYDVSWMAAGTHNEPATSTANHHPIHHSTQQQHHQQQQTQPYELAPAQITSSLEFPVPSAGYSASYKSDIFFAHPPGEENNLTWSSPSKLSNILNDSTSPYFPPVTLPSLNGDLALNTSIGASSGGYKATATGTAKKGQLQGAVGGIGQGSEGTSGSSFLSVSQLVNQPTKPSYHGNGSTGCQQKPPTNNYSAEALIGNNSYNPNAVSLGSTGHEPARKDKLFEYGCGIMEGGFSSSSVPSSAALTFPFDTYGTPSATDYNKGYNFAGPQQNGYVPPYATDGAAYGGVPGGCTGSSVGASGTAGLPYYGKTSPQPYCYPQPSVSTSSTTTYPSHVSLPQATQGGGVATGAGQDFTPYYLPTFGEKSSTTKHYHGITHCTSGSTGSSVGKVKKPHKTPVPTSSAVDFAFPATVTSASSYSYPALGNGTTSGATGDATQQVAESHSYPHYHHQQQPHQQHQQHQQQHDQRSQHHHHYDSATSETSSTLPSSIVSHKGSSTGSYTYRQYSASSSGFGSVKSGKSSQQERIHHQDHQHSSFPPVHGSTHHSHPHLDLSSCLNPPTAAGYGNHPSQSATVSYGTLACSSSSSSSSTSNRQHTSTTHPNSGSHHHQRHEQQHGLAGASASNTVATSMGHIGATNVSAAAGSCGTITNFNLSTICPEINDKTGRSRDESRAVGMPPVPLSVASLMTHW